MHIKLKLHSVALNILRHNLNILQTQSPKQKAVCEVSTSDCNIKLLCLQKVNELISKVTLNMLHIHVDEVLFLREFRIVNKSSKSGNTCSFKVRFKLLAETRHLNLKQTLCFLSNLELKFIFNCMTQQINNIVCFCIFTD